MEEAEAAALEAVKAFPPNPGVLWAVGPLGLNRMPIFMYCMYRVVFRVSSDNLKSGKKDGCRWVSAQVGFAGCDPTKLVITEGAFFVSLNSSLGDL